MGAAGSIDIDCIEDDVYDRGKLEALFEKDFDEEIFKKLAPKEGVVSTDSLKQFCKAHRFVRNADINFDAIKSLWFTAANGSKGRALVEVKDAMQSLWPVFRYVFYQYVNDSDLGMTVFDFRKIMLESKCGIEESFIDSNFYECVRYPDDEDDETEILSIKASVGRFSTAIVRIANACAVQETGESDKGLREQLIEWIMLYTPQLGVQIETLNAALGPNGLGICARDPKFFYPPDCFVGTTPLVFLQVAIVLDNGDLKHIGCIDIELDGVSTPKTAYNFYCLCTGERGLGEVTGLPLCYRGTCFHRVVPEMCIQGGDISHLDGYGGESVYGGEFEDEGFRIHHDCPGVVSMGNMGPNTNSSQFFITLGPAPHLDSENCAFGKVVSGMDIVKEVSEITLDEDERPIQKCAIVDCGSK